MTTSRDLKAIWNDVKANGAKLEACPGPHDFTEDQDPDRMLFKRWKCARCGGVVGPDAKHWYDRGLAHGREHA